mgnify:CR=1 FL=1
MSEADIRAERMKKLELLKLAGMEAYPVESGRTHEVAAFLEDFASHVQTGTNATLAGRLMARRGQGGIIFADLFDGTGRMQVVLQESEMEPEAFALFRDAADTGEIGRAHV